MVLPFDLTGELRNKFMGDGGELVRPILRQSCFNRPDRIGWIFCGLGNVVGNVRIVIFPWKTPSLGQKSLVLRGVFGKAEAGSPQEKQGILGVCLPCVF